MTALLLLRRFWPALAAAAVLLALWGWGNSRYDAGVSAERAAWEQEASRLRAIAAQEALARAAAVTAANDAATRSQASLDALAAQSRNDHATYYAKAGNDGACLDDSRVRAIEKAGTAAMETATTAR